MNKSKYGRVPKPPTPLTLEQEKAKLEKLKKQEQIEKEADSLFGDVTQHHHISSVKKCSPKTPQMMMSTADESTVEKRFSPESNGKRLLRGKRTYGDKKVRFDLISESESTPLPAKRRTRSKVNYAKLDEVQDEEEDYEEEDEDEVLDEEDDEEQEAEVIEQPPKKRQRPNPEDERRAREIKSKTQKIVQGSKYGSRIEKLLGVGGMRSKR